MKANGTPKKIYLDPKKVEESEFGIIDAIVPEYRVEKGDIEYIRTDAFIEKALAYLNDKFYFNNLFYGIVSTDFHAMEEMYDDFRKYMEGE